MDEAYELSSHVLVMEGVRTQILQLCEVGWLFRKINKYVNNTMGLVIYIYIYIYKYIYIYIGIFRPNSTEILLFLTGRTGRIL